MIDAVNSDAEQLTKANRDRALENALLEIGQSLSQTPISVAVGLVDGSGSECSGGLVEAGAGQGRYIGCSAGSWQQMVVVLTRGGCFDAAVEADVPETWIIEESRRKFASMMQEFSAQGKRRHQTPCMPQSTSTGLGPWYSPALGVVHRQVGGGGEGHGDQGELREVQVRDFRRTRPPLRPPPLLPPTTFAFFPRG